MRGCSGGSTGGPAFAKVVSWNAEAFFNGDLEKRKSGRTILEKKTAEFDIILLQEVHG